MIEILAKEGVQKDVLHWECQPKKTSTRLQNSDMGSIKQYSWITTTKLVHNYWSIFSAKHKKFWPQSAIIVIHGYKTMNMYFHVSGLWVADMCFFAEYVK